jgi:hypothetical protein
MTLKEELTNKTDEFIRVLNDDNTIKYWAAYLGSSHDNFNTYLRDHGQKIALRYRTDSGNLNFENDKKAVTAMKRCYQHEYCPKTSTEITVYRGAGLYIFETNSKTNIVEHCSDIAIVAYKIRQNIGRNFVEAGFLSTSLSKNHALTFVRDKKLLFEIKVPTETKFLFATKNLEKREKIMEQLRHEDEMIFAPGSIMQINEVTQEGTDPKQYTLVRVSLLRAE